MSEVRNALTRAIADGRYLLLDASNDPLTGDLIIQKTAPTLTLADIGEDYSISVSANSLTILNLTGVANGHIILDHQVDLYPSAPNTAAFTQKWGILFQPTLTIAPVSNFALISEQSTLSMNGVFSSFSIINALGILTNINASSGAAYLFVSGMISKSLTAGFAPASYRSFDHRGTIQGDGAAVGTTDHMRALFDLGVVSAINSGSITVTTWSIVENGSTGALGVISATAGASATVTNRYGFKYNNTVLAVAGGTEVLVNQYGLHISALTTATAINCGIWLDGASGATNNYGIVIGSDDINGGAIWFGAGQDAKIYYDGTDLFINPQVVGSGALTLLGDMLFSGNGNGLPYGEIWVKDNVTTMSVSSAGFTQVVNFVNNGQSNLTTPDHTNDHITINKAGKYMIDVSMAVVNAAGVGHVLNMHVSKNNDATVFHNLAVHRTLASGTDVGSGSMSGIVDLAVNDTVEVWISSDSGAARNITVQDITLSLFQLGG